MRWPKLSAVCLSVLLAACSEGSGDAATAASPENGEVLAFDEALEVVHTVRPEQNEDAVIARISGLAFHADGRFVISDVSESNVKVYGADGTLLRTLGRKGDGPGEFRGPRVTRFLDDDRVIIADADILRLTWWDVTRDSMLATVPVNAFTALMGFVIVDDTTGVISGTSEQDAHVLALIDLRDGSVRERLLPIRDVLPRGARGDYAWRSNLWFYLTARDDTAYVVATISDTLWSVHLPTRSVSRRSIAPAGYIAPSAPPEGLSGVQALLEWRKQYHMATPAVAGDGWLAVPFVRGVLNYGDPTLLSVLTPRGNTTVENPPPPLAAHDGMLVMLADPSADTVQFTLARWRQ